MNYPGTSKTFEKDKWYAWQIVAKDDRSYSAKTDVWVFKVNTSFSQSIVDQAPFLKMKKQNPEKGVAPNGILKIAYNNLTTDKKIKVQIINVGEAYNIKPIEFDANLIQGENNIQYDLKKIMPTQENKVYMARIVNSQNDTWLIRFEVKNYK
jgi:hypothetical protein